MAVLIQLTAQLALLFLITGSTDTAHSLKQRFCTYQMVLSEQGMAASLIDIVLKQSSLSSKGCQLPITHTWNPRILGQYQAEIKDQQSKIKILV